MSIEKLVSGKPKPLYLVLGDEALLVRDGADRLVEFALAGVQRAFDHAVFRAADERAMDLFSMTRTMPMLSPHRVLELRDIDEASVEVLEALFAYAQDPGRAAVVIVSGRTWPKAGPGKKVEAAVKKAGAVVRFKSRDQDPARFAMQTADELGVRLGSKEARQLVDSVGTDLGRVRMEVEKAALFVGGEGTITAEVIDEVCSLLAEAVIWDLTDAIAAKDPDKALSTAHRLLERGTRGEAHRLIAMVSWQLRRLLQLQDAMEHGGDVAYKLPGWKRKKIEAALRANPLDEARVMARVARANQDMNSHRAGDRRVFEGLLLDLVSRSGQRRPIPE